VRDLRLADLGLDVAVVHVEDLYPVDAIAELLLLEEPRVRDPGEQAPLRGFHELLQLLVREGLVSHELDGLHVEEVVFPDVDDDVDVAFPDLLGREVDLGVEVPLVVVEPLDLVRVGLDPVGIVDLLDLERQDPPDVVGLEGVITLDADVVDEGPLVQQEGDHLALRRILHVGLHVAEIARAVDGPDVGREVLLRKEFSLCALERVEDDGVLDPAVARQLHPGDDLPARDPGKDLPRELGRKGPRVLDARPLGEQARDRGARFHVDGLSVEAHPRAELGEAAEDHVVGLYLSSHGDRQPLVGFLPADERGEFFSRDDLDRPNLPELEGHAVVDGIAQQGRVPLAVDVEGQDGDPLCEGRRGRGEQASEENEEHQCSGFSGCGHITCPSRSVRRAGRCIATCVLPATGCG